MFSLFTARLRKGEAQAQLEKRQKRQETFRKLFAYFSLFQYSTKSERIFIALAIFLAIMSACIPPLVNVLYGEFCNILIDRQFPSHSSSTKTTILAWFGGGRILQNASREERSEALEEDSKAWGIGCGSFTLLQFILSFVSVSLLCLTASRQMSRIKILFFKSTICKDMTWFDSQMDGNFAGRASENLFLIERGIADLLSVITFQLVVGVINIVICFIRSWILSLIMLMVIIPVIVSVFIKLKFQTRLSEGEMEYFAKAGSVAEEAFTSIRTVVAFGGEAKEVDRYLQYLEESKANGIRRGAVAGISSGIVWFIIYCSYATAFFLGTRLVLTSRTNKDYEFTPADLIIVLFGMLTGLTNFGYAAGHFETISVACAAAASVFKVINSQPTINPCLNVGLSLEAFKGEIEFRNVHFDYPSRPSIKILKGVNLKIKAGERVAIVGGSGAGKSTILQLVQRLYDPSQGEVLLDGYDIKNLQVSWLRGQMGVVSQEPLLFATTIRENISFGYPPATERDIENAARKANAHSFIISLKDKYNTIVGQKGSTLSGGQKQRIAIARALVRNPKILLLDEATSALDAASEKLVEEALNRASVGRTTLIVTHRLSTITNVDRILVLDNGLLAEEGTHEELIRINGIYKKLLNSQHENIAEKKRQKIEIPKNPIIYEDEAVFPPGRFSSASIYGSHPKALEFSSLERLERFKKSSYIDIMKWSKPERLYLVCGSIASIIGGTALPAVCVLLGSLCGLFASTDTDFILDRTDLYSSLLVVIGIVSGLCVFLQMYCFSVAALQLSTRIRVKYFDCMIRQEIPWFEHEENRVGVLCLRLSQDASEMQRAVGTHIGILLQALSTLIFGTVLCFFFNWKITSVTIFTIPFVFAGVCIETAFVGGFGDVGNRSSEKALRIAVEVISNIKAVSNLGNESYFIKKYTVATKEMRKINILRACLRGLSFAVGQTVPFFGYAIALWYGGLLVARENLHYQYVIMVTEILIFGAWTLGQSVIITPNFGETKAAVGRLKYIFLRKSRIQDGEISSGPEFDSNNYVKYSKVGFSYPTDPGTEVLRNFNIVIKSGESVAIMGPSGSGKSTVIQLLLRFYMPTYGAIYINNVNIEEYKLSSLRKLLGLVSQEPVLFNRTIKENIAYGDNSREVPLGEIIQAAEAANIHSFIQSLPFGYDTTLGAGTQLSGGQKQRIAIARVLVRKPQIILLDEATSALDPESEGIVQDALDSASSGRTTITIAHRFSAARNADIIYVMEKGIITESGTHQELMKRKGKYYSMFYEGNK